MDQENFPIQGDYRKHEVPTTIPWWLAEEAYKVYSELFGTQQSLKRIAERGGFGRGELLAYLRHENPFKTKGNFVDRYIEAEFRLEPIKSSQNCPKGGLHLWKSSDTTARYEYCEKCGVHRTDY